MRPTFHWDLGSRFIELGKRTLVMGILNVTPDSFSDGGKFLDPEMALEHATRLLDEGADIVDIGGESTRPGARVSPDMTPQSATSDSSTAKKHAVVSAEEELQRVIPVITGVKKKHPSAVVSVDTYKAAVAGAAVRAGAEIVNDVSGFRWDPAMARTLADLRCGAVLMHMRGRPEEWRSLPPPDDIVQLVKAELTRWADDAVAAGVLHERIVLDPGFGFGKSFEQNYPLIEQFAAFHAIGFPLIVGTSRKSFIGRTIGGEKKVAPEDRLFGTLATETALILSGAHIIRTHDVKPSIQVAQVADAILNAR